MEIIDSSGEKSTAFLDDGDPQDKGCCEGGGFNFLVNFNVGKLKDCHIKFVTVDTIKGKINATLRELRKTIPDELKDRYLTSHLGREGNDIISGGEYFSNEGRYRLMKDNEATFNALFEYFRLDGEPTDEFTKRKEVIKGCLEYQFTHTDFSEPPSSKKVVDKTYFESRSNDAEFQDEDKTKAVLSIQRPERSEHEAIPQETHFEQLRRQFAELDSILSPPTSERRS